MMVSTLIAAMALPAPVQPKAANPNATQCVASAESGVGILTNKCDFRVVAFACVTGPPRADVARYFDCARGQVGSYDLPARGQAPAILRGAKRVHWFACRFPEYLPREVKYHAGKGLRGSCE
ncbi:hypothetical protein [Sphingomonas sp. LT1P40]|uniref:hypothetical protein n=1 Tax=Alteristakelama amylovorans TaxID=3096166 RepID=UPI002FCC58FE